MRFDTVEVHAAGLSVADYVVVVAAVILVALYVVSARRWGLRGFLKAFFGSLALVLLVIAAGAVRWALLHRLPSHVTLKSIEIRYAPQIERLQELAVRPVDEVSGPAGALTQDDPLFSAAEILYAEVRRPDGTRETVKHLYGSWSGRGQGRKPQPGAPVLAVWRYREYRPYNRYAHHKVVEYKGVVIGSDGQAIEYVLALDVDGMLAAPRGAQEPTAPSNTKEPTKEEDSQADGNGAREAPTESAKDDANLLGPVDDPVEQFIRMAVETQDGLDTVNAYIFRPDDKLFAYEYKKRPGYVPDTTLALKKFDPIASFNDVSRGPRPAEQTDQIEARMLMDKALVGDRLWHDVVTSAGEMLLVFIESPSVTMSYVREKYGAPTKTVNSGQSQLHFYGRMIFVETSGGQIHSVLRRGIKGTQ